MITAIILAVFCVTVDATNIINDDVLIQMLTRIEALEKRDHEHTRKNEEQAAHISNIESILVNQVATNKHTEDRINQLEKHFAEQKETIETLEQEVFYLRQSSNSRAKQSKQKQSISTNAKLAENESKQRRLVLDDNEGPIAFQARIMKGEMSHIGIHQKFVFDNVLTNLGNGYHNLHGLFIAPRGGIYIFSTSILSYINAHSEFYASIMKNGIMIARVYGHGDTGRNDQGSATIVTPLVIGDEVWVELSGPVVDDSIYGNGYSSFMGCLITPQ